MNSRYLDIKNPLLIRLIIFGVAISSFILQELSPITLDVSIHLHVAKRILAGDVLYSDIILTNTPFVYYFRTIPVLLSEIGSISLVAASNLVNTVLALICSLLLLKVIEKSFFSNDKTAFAVVMVAVLCTYFFIPIQGLFGQKEHLMFIFMCPYIFLIFIRQDIDIGRFSRLVIYFLMALAICIKPPYIFVWILLEVLNSRRKKSWSSLFYAGNWVLGLTGATYLFLMLNYTPFYSNVMPMMEVYYYFQYSKIYMLLLSIVSLSIAPLLLIIPFICSLFKDKISESDFQKNLRLFILSLLLLAVPVCLAIIMQGKMGGNKFVVYIYIMYIAGCLSGLYCYRVYQGRLFIQVLITFYAIFFMAVTVSFLIKDDVGDHWDKVMLQYSPDKKVAAVTAKFFFDRWAYHGLEFDTKYYHLWPISGAVNMQEFAPELARAKNIDKLKAEVYADTFADIKTHRPSLLIIADKEDLGMHLKESVNHLKAMMDIDGFADFIKGYRLVDTKTRYGDNQYRIYVRIDDK